MNKFSKFWTYGVAYLSLAVGSGVSIAGNIADTYRVANEVAHRPVDGLDTTISAFWPAAVLLAIEMFVSTLWPTTWRMQLVRWVGSLGIGFVAMYVSWHHLSDLMSSRGQDGLVSTLGPLAIDGLAVMATGLILSSRGHKRLDQPLIAPAREVTPAQMFGWDTPAATQPIDPSWTAEDQAMLDAWDRDMDKVDEVVPVSPAPALGRSNEVKPESVPETAKALFREWANASETDRPKSGDMYALVGAEHGVSARSARRWYYAAKATL